MEAVARQAVRGTKGLAYTIAATDPIFGEVFDVFTRPTRNSTKIKSAGMVVPSGTGTWLAFADGNHSSSTIGPEMSGGHATRDAAALAAIVQTQRAAAVQARFTEMIAQ